MFGAPRPSCKLSVPSKRAEVILGPDKRTSYHFAPKQEINKHEGGFNQTTFFFVFVSLASQQSFCNFRLIQDTPRAFQCRLRTFPPTSFPSNAACLLIPDEEKVVLRCGNPPPDGFTLTFPSLHQIAAEKPFTQGEKADNRETRKPRCTARLDQNPTAEELLDRVRLCAVTNKLSARNSRYRRWLKMAV